MHAMVCESVNICNADGSMEMQHVKWWVGEVRQRNDLTENLQVRS